VSPTRTRTKGPGTLSPRIRRPCSNRHLIWIKASVGIRDIMLSRNRRSFPMPLDIILVVIIAGAFGILAATLFWADLQTRELGK
jgi:hypothetical protein